ncbi:MAG: hypothetical protein H6Q68_1400 [Firmicutes bacterium]|nr:hypothetical protein [Bacillota bacterium]
MATTKKTFDVIVEHNACKGCGYCKEVCGVKVFENAQELNSQGYRYMTAAHREKCVGCLRCFMVCPDFAITVNEM